MFRLWKSGKHRGYKEDLSAYIDNRLGSARKAELEAHLAQCQACRAELESLRQMVGLLRRMPVAQPPRLFTIRQPEPTRQATLGMALRVATSVAAVLLALVFALDMSHVFQNAPPAIAPAATATASPEKSSAMAAVPNAGPAPTPSPVPQPSVTSLAPSGPAGLAGAAGPAGPSPTTEISPTPQLQPTPRTGGPVAAGMVPTPTPTSTPVPTPTPAATLVPTPAPTDTPRVMAAVPSASTQDHGAAGIQQPSPTRAAGTAAAEPTTKATSRVPFRPLEWALLGLVLALGAAIVIVNKTQQRETRGGRK